MKDLSKILAQELFADLKQQEQPDKASAFLLFGQGIVPDESIQVQSEILPTINGWRASVVCLDLEDPICFQRIILQECCRTKAIARIVTSYAIRSLTINQQVGDQYDDFNQLASNFN